MSIKKILSLLFAICLLLPMLALAEGEISLNSISYKRYNTVGEEYVTVQRLRQGSMYSVLSITNSGAERDAFIINTLYAPGENAVADISVVKKAILPGTNNYESKVINVSENTFEGTLKTFVLGEYKLSFEFSETFTENASSELYPETEAALERLNQFIGKDVVQWAINLYDPDTGGFYATTSSRDYDPFTPYAESTYFVTDILKGGGMLSSASMPQWWKDKVGVWIKSHQSEADGYFYEDIFGQYTTGVRRNRDLQYSTWLLNRVGYTPLYKTPQERLEEKAALLQSGSLLETSSVPTHLQSEENFLAYLDSLDWSTKGIWNTGNMLSSESSVIKSAGLFDAAREYIEEKQNPETGLWGEGLTYNNTNGTMKLSVFFDKEHPFPNLGKMIKSSIKIQQESEVPEMATYIWNVVEAMGRAIATYNPVPEEVKEYISAKAPLIINTTVDNALRFKAPDGGFTSSYGEAGSVGEGGRIGYGLPEGDVDGTRIISTLLRDSFAKILGISLGKTYFKEYESWFWEEIQKKETINKKTLPVIDFETIDTFSTLRGITGRGTYGIVADPVNPENKCLKIDKSVSEDISINLPVPGGRNFSSMTFTMNIMVERMTNPNFFGFRVGIESYDSVFQLGSDGDWTLSNEGEAITSDNLTKGQWHQLKVEYTPKGLTDSILKFYVDDNLVKTTNKIYLGASGTNTTVPNMVSGMRFYSWAASPGLGVVYIDNINANYN